MKHELQTKKKEKDWTKYDNVKKGIYQMMSML